MIAANSSTSPSATDSTFHTSFNSTYDSMSPPTTHPPTMHATNLGLLCYYRRQYPMFTKANSTKDNQMQNKLSQRHLSSGWNKDGLETFNRLAREVLKDREKHGVQFDKAFKTSCEEAEWSSTKPTRKRKRNIIETYSDLHGGEGIKNKKEHIDSDGEAENWVAEHVFMV